MGWHDRDPGHLRRRADRARAKGKSRRAVRLYRKLLVEQPENPVVHRRLAPLLARRRKRDDSWRSYVIACDSLADQGFDAKAAGLLREAVDLLPGNADAWRRLAEMEEGLGRQVDARNTLLEGRQNLRGSRRRAEAITLLKQAHRLDEDDPEVALDLARLLRLSRRRAKAQQILYRLAARVPARRRAARWALFLTAPSVRSFWAWLACPRPPAEHPSRA